MQIGKQWQHLTKRSVNECVFNQQGKPHTPTGTGKLTSLCVCVCVCVCVCLCVSYFTFLSFFFILHHSHTHTYMYNDTFFLLSPNCFWLFPCLLSLTASPPPALSIPVDVPAMWDPSATVDSTDKLPAEIALQQVQIMASIVLALLSEPFCEYHVILHNETKSETTT